MHKNFLFVIGILMMIWCGACDRNEDEINRFRDLYYLGVCYDDEEYINFYQTEDEYNDNVAIYIGMANVGYSVEMWGADYSMGFSNSVVNFSHHDKKVFYDWVCEMLKKGYKVTIEFNIQTNKYVGVAIK